MTAYFVMVPDHWSPTTMIVPSGTQSDAAFDENSLQAQSL